jgi:hypothetical protein
VPGYSGDGGASANSQLRVPAGVAVDAAGNVYITDTGNGVIRKISDGIITTFSSNSLLASPSAITIDASGNLYVAVSSVCQVAFPGAMFNGTIWSILKISNGAVTTTVPGVSQWKPTSRRRPRA